MTLSVSKTYAGTGAPEGALIATQGSVYERTDGGTGTTFYVKESGSSSTGWRAIPGAVSSAYTQTYATASRTQSNPTAAALTVTDGTGTNDGTIGAITADASVIAAVQEIAAMVAKIITDHANTKQVLNSVIDDLQTISLLG